MKKYVLILFIPLTILSIVCCGGASKNEKTSKMICDYIAANYNIKEGDTIVFNFNDALSVDYDMGYLFGEEIQAIEMSKIMGIPYNNSQFIPDSKYRIILLKNNRIVYENDFYQRGIEFDISEEQDSLGLHITYGKFCTHKFQAIKKKYDLSDDFFYKLRPLCN